MNKMLCKKENTSKRWGKAKKYKRSRIERGIVESRKGGVGRKKKIASKREGTRSQNKT